MSYYYNYYIGYMSEEKVYPLGPYNCKGKLKDVISRSASFASDLHEDFFYLKDDMISDELRKEFSYTNWNDEVVMQKVKYLPVEALPKGSAIKRGYFLIEDVKNYEDDPDSFDGFYDYLNPTVYSAMANNEVRFGKPEPVKDSCGEEYYPKSASDYMYYAYEDWHSKEYEADILRTVAYMLGEYDYDLPKGYKLVILETEG